MKEHIIRKYLFTPQDELVPSKLTDGKKYEKEKITLNNEIIERLKCYDLEKYIKDVEKNGLKKTWDYICQFELDYLQFTPSFLNIKNFGELYEIGLAIQDKILKKKSGQYYTPDDVAQIMSEWLENCDGINICDVACGTGKLILTYLEHIGFDRARELISNGRLYLYDFDNIALKICWTTLAIKYGLDIAYSIHDVFCDFLDPAITLPENSKVISNPPYAQIEEMQHYWKQTEVLLDTKEYYSAFMEKIFSQATSTVIITPFSFISGNKFYSLRKKMCELGNGYIFSFDNVPGNIFCGRKHGIFNTNTSNSVRAAITILNRSNDIKGFKISPLIRFKNEERKKLLNCSVLENELPKKFQIISKTNKSFEKVEKSLSSLFQIWKEKSKYNLKDFVSNDKTNWLIDMPNTCRYYTTASGRKLERTGSITMNIKNEDMFNFLYCFINSSFTYWWWRIYDGGITYPTGLLNSMPLPFNLLTDEDKSFFKKTAKKLLEEENNFIITKVNAGVAQENIKFPETYRDIINNKIIQILGYDHSTISFNKVHANNYFGVLKTN